MKRTGKEFGARLNTLRVSRGESLNSLARAAGVDPSFLSRIERGLVGAPEQLIHALAAELGCPAEPLLVLGGYLPEDIDLILREQPERAIAVLRKALGRRNEPPAQEAG